MGCADWLFSRHKQKIDWKLTSLRLVPQTGKLLKVVLSSNYIDYTHLENHEGTEGQSITAKYLLFVCANDL